jgi:hypothetical protein
MGETANGREGETANGRGKLREGASAYGRIGVVERNGASWARLGRRFGLANSRGSTTVFLCSAITVFREPRPTIDGQLPNANLNKPFPVEGRLCVGRGTRSCRKACTSAFG